MEKKWPTGLRIAIIAFGSLNHPWIMTKAQAPELVTRLGCKPAALGKEEEVPVAAKEGTASASCITRVAICRSSALRSSMD